MITSERAAEYPFSKICGGLAAIISMSFPHYFYTLGDGMVVDQFDVRDSHRHGGAESHRVNKVEMTIRKS